MAASNLPVNFAEVAVGAILLRKGVLDVKGAVQSGASVNAPSAQSATTGSGSVPTTGGAQHGLVSMAALAQIGRQYGWTGQQLADWMQVIILESNGQLNDTNPSSGAYGIAQFINGPSEYYSYGGNPNTLWGQLTAMAKYIQGRYGTPAAALQFHLANGYY